jgi:hypothetical protein
MPHIAPTTERQLQSGDPLSAIKTIRKSYEQLASVFNGRIAFGNPTSGADNLDGKWVTVITPVGFDHDFTVKHNLGRLPVGYLPMSKSSPCDIYTGSVPATKTDITLRATIGRVTVVLFIL